MKSLEIIMRKWAVPLTVAGLGGLGALLLSERGRQALRWAWERFNEAPQRFAAFNDSAQQELDRIQATLNEIADSLGSRPVRS